MAIHYKVIQKGQPGVVGGGVQKHYAAIVYDSEATVDDLVTEIEKFSALSEPDIRGVITALENVIQNKLGDSKIVRLDRLGVFYPTLRSEGRDNAEDVTAHAIKGVGVNYRPGTRIIKAMKAKDLKKVK
jgi:predicted histone-like DNA-binding protein